VIVAVIEVPTVAVAGVSIVKLAGGPATTMTVLLVVVETGVAVAAVMVRLPGVLNDTPANV
jgi:hypothetical protein